MRPPKLETWLQDDLCWLSGFVWVWGWRTPIIVTIRDSKDYIILGYCSILLYHDYRVGGSS